MRRARAAWGGTRAGEPIAPLAPLAARFAHPLASTLQASTLQASTLQASRPKASTLLASTLQASTLLASTLLASTLLASTLLASTLLASTLLASTLLAGCGPFSAAAARAPLAAAARAPLSGGLPPPGTPLAALGAGTSFPVGQALKACEIAYQGGDLVAAEGACREALAAIRSAEDGIAVGEVGLLAAQALADAPRPAGGGPPEDGDRPRLVGAWGEIGRAGFERGLALARTPAALVAVAVHLSGVAPAHGGTALDGGLSGIAREAFARAIPLAASVEEALRLAEAARRFREARTPIPPQAVLDALDRALQLARTPGEARAVGRRAHALLEAAPLRPFQARARRRAAELAAAPDTPDLPPEAPEPDPPESPPESL